MGNNFPTVVLLVGALIAGVWVVLRYLYTMLKMYQFFNEYVGYIHAHHVVNYKKAYQLYQRLSTIRRSVTGEDIFDLALINFTHRLNDQDIYEKTKAMLHAIEPSYYKNSQKQLSYTEAEVQRYCFELTGFSNKPDMIRFLLWLIILNPVSVRKLNEL